MQSCTRTFTNSVQTVNRAFAMKVDFDASTHIMRTGTNRNILFGDVYTDAQTLFVNMWEMFFGFFGIFVCHI